MLLQRRARCVGRPGSSLIAPRVPAAARQRVPRSQGPAPASRAAAAAAAPTDSRRKRRRPRAMRLAAAASAVSDASALDAAPPPIPAARQVWRISKQGALANLALETEPMPQLAPGQALVAVECVGLNFADVFCCLGLYKAAPKGAFIPGLEFCGTVLAVAPPADADAAAAAAGPPAVRPGDRVIGVTRFGGYVTHAALDAAYLRPCPPEWTAEQGAAFAVQALTAAHGLLNLGALREATAAAPPGRGAAVLVQSAAGGVGLQALAICDALGARALALVGSEAKAEALRSLLLARRHPEAAAAAAAAAAGGGAGPEGPPRVEVAARVSGAGAARAQLRVYLERQGLDGFDVFFDSAGGDYLAPGFEALAPCGRHIIFGAGTLTPPPGASLVLDWRLLWPPNLVAALRLAAGWLSRPKLDVLSLPGTNTGSLGFNLIYLYNKQDLMADLYAKVESLRLPPPHVGLAEPWDRLPAALEALQGGGTTGKVVVKIN